jgi:hemolysin activation/secretion protein
MKYILTKPFKLWIGTLLFLSHLLQASPLIKQVDDIIRYEAQKKIYEEQAEARQTPEAIYTELTPIPLSKESNASEACIRIDSIDTEEITLIDKEVLDALMKPYLHRCDTMQDINTLV